MISAPLKSSEAFGDYFARLFFGAEPKIKQTNRVAIAPLSLVSVRSVLGKVLGKSDDRSNRWLDLFDINRKMIREKRLRTTKLTTDGSKLKIKGPGYVCRVRNS